MLLIPDGIKALKEQSQKEKEAREKARRDYEAILERTRREGYEAGLEQGRREAREQSHIEGFQQGYKDGFKQGRSEERQRVIQALALLETQDNNAMRIVLTASQYLQIILSGQPDRPV